MPIIKEDGYCIVKRNRRDGRYNSTYEGRVFKRPATLLGGRQDEKYAGKIERHQDSKRDLQKGSRVISQQGNEHSLPQDSRTGSQQATDSLPQDSRTGSQQGNGHSLPQESSSNEHGSPQDRTAVNKKREPSTREQNNRKTPPSARSGNQQAKRQSQKNQTRVSRGRQARPTQSATIQINRQTRQSARETRKVAF
jgi:hypothetical protein